MSHAISVHPSNTVKGQNNNEICDPTKASTLNLFSDRARLSIKSQRNDRNEKGKRERDRIECVHMPFLLNDNRRTQQKETICNL